MCEGVCEVGVRCDTLLQVSGWSFVVGYLLQTVIALIRAGTKAVYQPGRKQPFLLSHTC